MKRILTAAALTVFAAAGAAGAAAGTAAADTGGMNLPSVVPLSGVLTPRPSRPAPRPPARERGGGTPAPRPPLTGTETKATGPPTGPPPSRFSDASGGRQSAITIDGVSFVRISPRKNAGLLRCITSMITTPRSSSPTPMTKTEPTPKTAEPEPYAGSHMS